MTGYWDNGEKTAKKVGNGEYRSLKTDQSNNYSYIVIDLTTYNA